MPRIHPQPRLPLRLLASLTGVVLGLVGTIAIAGPAGAQVGVVAGQAVCDESARQWVVTWTSPGRALGGGPPYTMVEAAAEPSGSTWWSHRSDRWCR